jgi:biotin carboxylase
MDLLQMQQGALNFDIRVDAHDQVFLMEVGPRNGGNLIPEVTRYATGVDMIAHTLEAALGIEQESLRVVPSNGFYASYILHSTTAGIFDHIHFSEDLERRIVERDVWVRPGADIKPFDGSNQTLGGLIVRFDSESQMIDDMENMEKHVTVALRPDS